MFKGIVKYLFVLPSLYLNTITDRFTDANVRNKNKFVMFATISRSPIKLKIIVITINSIIDNQGVLVFLWTKANEYGRTFFFAMPYNNLDVVTNVIRIVFEVENKAIIPIIKIAIGPKEETATSDNGEDEDANFCQFNMLTEDIATSM